MRDFQSLDPHLLSCMGSRHSAGALEDLQEGCEAPVPLPSPLHGDCRPLPPSCASFPNHLPPASAEEKLLRKKPESSSPTAQNLGHPSTPGSTSTQPAVPPSSCPQPHTTSSKAGATTPAHPCSGFLSILETTLPCLTASSPVTQPGLWGSLRTIHEMHLSCSVSL